jgi:lysophospholipase L1-like esterase
MRTYLALGDSMSIDAYTGVTGGGAVSQFFRYLGSNWSVDDRTCDGCRIRGVPLMGHGDLITLTVGGNDLLWNRDAYVREGIDDFQRAHAGLLKHIRRVNPDALFIVGDIYEPDLPLSDVELRGLAAANGAISINCTSVGARLAPIHDVFHGRTDKYLCLGIEPTLAGATAIAGLFAELFQQHWRPSGDD